jgi:hypothetical protein
MEGIVCLYDTIPWCMYLIDGWKWTQEEGNTLLVSYIPRSVEFDRSIHTALRPTMALGCQASCVPVRPTT